MSARAHSLPNQDPECGASARYPVWQVQLQRTYSEPPHYSRRSQQIQPINADEYARKVSSGTAPIPACPVPLSSAGSARSSPTMTARWPPNQSLNNKGSFAQGFIPAVRTGTVRRKDLHDVHACLKNGKEESREWGSSIKVSILPVLPCPVCYERAVEPVQNCTCVLLHNHRAYPIVHTSKASSEQH